MSEPKITGGEKPGYRDAIDGTTRELIKQGLPPQVAHEKAKDAARRSEDRQDRRR